MRRSPREQLSLEFETLRAKLYGTERRESLIAVLILAPVVGGVSWLSLAVDWLPFVLFPPLAAMTYNLFADPARPTNIPWQYPVALTAGALSGAASLRLAHALGVAAEGPFQVDPVTATLTVLLAGGFLYLFDTEIAPALAVGLLLPFAGVPPAVYVVNVFVGATIVTASFAVWRRAFHDEATDSSLTAADHSGLGEEGIDRGSADGEADTGEFVFDR